MRMRVRRFVVALGSAMAMAAASCADGIQGSNVATTFKTSPMRTHCLGRFLVDLPEGLEQTPGSEVDLTYGLDKNFRTIKVKVLRSIGSTPTLEATVAKLTTELSARRSDETPTKSMLASVRQVNTDTALIRAHEEPVMRGYFRAQVVAKKEDAIADVVADIFKRDTPETIEAKALAVADRTTFIRSHAAAGRGACLGPLLIDAGQDGETFTVSFQAKQWPDVTLSFYLNSLVAEPGEGLLRRWDSKSGMLGAVGFKSTTLRRGKVQIGGKPGEELLSQGKEHERVVRHFTAEVLRDAPASFLVPQMSIDMEMGGQIRSGEYVDPSFSETDALALWDAIIKSIRPRPGAV
jgi:Tle cognate immunity protein 4 C-terminal domain